MDGLIARITQRTGLDADTAEKAVGIILGFLKKEGPPEEVEQMLRVMPQAEEMIAKGEAAAGGGGMMGAMGGMMGGGVGAEAEYVGDGDSFTITILADNPMVGAMSAMIGNAAAMGMKVERIGREKFAVQDDTVQGLVDNRILVKAEGGDVPTMLKLLEEIDYRELGRFGQ